MKRKPIKQEIKTFAILLRKELNSRDKYVQQQSNEWYETQHGQNYAGMTEALEILWQYVSQACDELMITLPKLK